MSLLLEFGEKRCNLVKSFLFIVSIEVEMTLPIVAGLKVH